MIVCNVCFQEQFDHTTTGIESSDGEPREAQHNELASDHPADILKAIQALDQKLDQALSEPEAFRCSTEALLHHMQQDINDKIAAECQTVREDLQTNIPVMTCVAGVDTRLAKIKSDMDKAISELNTRVECLDKKRK